MLTVCQFCSGAEIFLKMIRKHDTSSFHSIVLPIIIGEISFTIENGNKKKKKEKKVSINFIK